MTMQIRKSIPRLLIVLCLITCFFAGVIQAYAVPACPFPMKIKQPDGSIITAYNRGDEYQSWTETENGYSIVRNAKSTKLEYAAKSRQGKLVPSGKLVSSKISAPSGIIKHLKPNRMQPMQQTGEINFSSQGGALLGKWSNGHVEGTRNLLIIMVSFADIACSTSPSGWNDTIFNTTTGVKSVANFYSDNSFGHFGITPVPHSEAGNPAGIVSVTLTQDHPNYGGDLDYDKETAWINEALAQASSVVDFPALDTDGDGTLQTSEAVIYFIVAGYEASGKTLLQTPSIWAHAWGGPGVSAGGIEINAWAMNGELNKYNAQHPMGVIAHELGHSMCGLPDLYDTSNTNAGLGVFSLMSAGSWGKSFDDPFYGSTPVALDAWSRQYLGWSSPQIPTGPEMLYFYPALDKKDSSVKLINSTVSRNEYFLAENRYPDSWDMGLQAYLGSSWSGGILILHVDETIGDPDKNDINTYVPGRHQGVMAEEANTWYGSMYAGTSDGDVTHLFYKENKSKFDNIGTPNSKLYGNIPTYLGLQNISPMASIMTANPAIGTVATPAFYPDGGTYPTEVNVVITCATPDAVIHYTTDGTDPTETSPAISSGAVIPIRSSVTLKARAWLTGLYASNMKVANEKITKPGVVYVSSRASGKQDGKSWKTAYKSIRQAINVAPQRSEIWVAAGAYQERITVKSYVSLYGGFSGTETNRWERNPKVNITTIDGRSMGTVVTVLPNVLPATVIDGFTIRGGKSVNGGGIYCFDTSPTITHNIIKENVATTHGGGIYCRKAASGYIASNVITDNTALDGGGIYCETLTYAVILNNVVARNSTKWGGGIFLSQSGGMILGNTVSDNTATTEGGGIYCYYSSPQISNNIVAFCSSGMYSTYPFAYPYAYNNCVYENGGYNSAGVFSDGNMNDDPLFADRERGDYHLQPSSGCINAGDDSSLVLPYSDFDGEQRIFGSHSDIGADEFVN